MPMINYIIPTAYAQTAVKTQAAVTAVKDTAAVATESGTGSLQGLFQFVFSHLDNWIGGIIIIAIAFMFANNAAKAAKERIIKSKGEEVPENALILVERMTKISIITIGIVVAAAINGMNLAAVVGAVSLGIGFAIKDIVGNFISSIVMLSQNRIRIGDFVKVGDILGTIVSIDTRVTVLQAIDGTEVVVPNQTMLNETLVSYSTNPFRRIELIVGVDYSTDLPMVTSLIKGILEKHPEVVPKPPSLVLVDAFSDSSINIKILFWIESNKNWMEIRSNIAYRIKKAFNELHINIPFPIRTLKLDENDRAFLQTMDSLKKGVVPEQSVIPQKEAIRQSAEGTQNAPKIPYSPFEAESHPHADLIEALDDVVGQKPATAIPTPQKPSWEKVQTTPPTHM